MHCVPKTKRALREVKKATFYCGLDRATEFRIQAKLGVAQCSAFALLIHCYHELFNAVHCRWRCVVEDDQTDRIVQVGITPCTPKA
jgi:hypothetical protein